MRLTSLIKTILSISVSQGSLFLLQSYFIAQHRYNDVVELGKYIALFGLIFFVFDGNSGLVYSVLRRRYDDTIIRRAFRQYRAVLGGVIVVSACAYAFFGGQDGAFVAIGICASLVFRFSWIDGYLDKRGDLWLAVLLSNMWMMLVCMVAILTSRVDGLVVSAGAVTGSAIMAATRYYLSVPGEYEAPTHSPAAARQAVLEIARFMGLYGYGQIYGRATIFAVGSLFGGGSAALLLYAKQTFNLSGLVVGYIRRLEAVAHRDGHWRVGEMKFSIYTQLVTGLGAAALVVVSGWYASLTSLAAMAVAWQALEKVSGNAVYAFQMMDQHHRGYVSLVMISIMGFAGLVAGKVTSSVFPYILAETIAFLLVGFYWARKYSVYARRQALTEATL